MGFAMMQFTNNITPERQEGLDFDYCFIYVT
jgi:hypothetical protein